MIADMTVQCPCCGRENFMEIDAAEAKSSEFFDWPLEGDPRCLACWINERTIGETNAE